MVAIVFKIFLAKGVQRPRVSRDEDTAIQGMPKVRVLMRLSMHSS